MVYEFRIGNDNGNSEHDIVIDGDLIQQPNVIRKDNELPWQDDYINLSSIINNLESQLITTINSPSIKDAGMYYIGEYALNSGKPVENFIVGQDKKHEIDLPIIATLSNIAAKAVKKYFNENKSIPGPETEIQINCDMATALPVTQFKPATAESFSNKFLKGPHKVTVHIGPNRVNTTINFTFTKTLAEGSPVVFALMYKVENGELVYRDGNDPIFQEFAKTYGIDNIDGEFFRNLKILHCDIGDGTTEYPVTWGNKFKNEFVHGSNHGAGHAIDEALPEFNESIFLPDSPRQFMSQVLKDKSHKFYSKAERAIKAPADMQSKHIIKNIGSQLNKTRNDIDVICVYGGGSILLRDYMYEKVKTLAEQRDMKVLYIPKEYAVKLNAIGLYNFTFTPIYRKIKEIALSK